MSTDLGLEFCLVIERGILEAQALLLCESIRAFGGRWSSAPITAVSPRPERRPFAETIQRLQGWDVSYRSLDLYNSVPLYGPSFRVFALAEVARQPGPPILVQLDSDTIFLREPDLAMAVDRILARPVDVKGMCSQGIDDPQEVFWQAMSRVNAADLEDIGFVTPTTEQRLVRASYNGGLIAAPRRFYSVVEQCFLNIVNAGIRPHPGLAGLRSGAESVHPDGAEFWGTTQAAISIAAALLKLPVHILDENYNIPLHMLEQLVMQPGTPVHVHYHWLFEEHEENPLFQGLLAINAAQTDWLKCRLPLRKPDGAHVS